MSVIVAVGAAAAVGGGSALFSAVAAAAAAGLGLKAIEASAQDVEERRRDELAQAELRQMRAEAERVEISSATEAALTDIVAEAQELHFAGEGIELMVRRDIRGKVSVTAHGHGMTRAEVEAFANRYLGLLRQQVAYREAVQALKRHGFAVAEEAREADGTVQVRVRRGGGRR
ncbi:MAG: DUF1257 domain-containing protein [Alphaproteobacteria bacterium]|nr:DUF1257 domain-containing protein [Alphaproteobacteria bacterium]